MTRFVYSTFVGLIGAAIVHLLIIFLLPTLSTIKSWNFILENADAFQPTEILVNSLDENQNYSLDPLFRHFVCRYDLSEGAVKVTATTSDIFWSLAVFDSIGTTIFSANDRIAANSQIDLAVLNPKQLRFVRQNSPEETSASLIASATTDQGFILIRAFVPDSSWQPAASKILETMECSTLEF
ncbi:MAG: DUF1254 domain-containing protein [Ahrensia sp.]|nr:DUF1254 domain-containing protein [Ahrensia sp.]